MKIWWFIILLQSWTEKARFGGSFQTINWPKDYSRKYWKISPSTGTHASRLEFVKKWVAKSQPSFSQILHISPILDKIPQLYLVPSATKIKIRECPLMTSHVFWPFLTYQSHTACIWFWMAKDVGVASDGNFSSYLIGRSWYNHFQSFSMGGNGNNTIHPLLST